MCVAWTGDPFGDLCPSGNSYWSNFWEIFQEFFFLGFFQKKKFWGLLQKFLLGIPPGGLLFFFWELIAIGDFYRSSVWEALWEFLLGFQDFRLGNAPRVPFGRIFRMNPIRNLWKAPGGIPRWNFWRTFLMELLGNPQKELLKMSSEGSPEAIHKRISWGALAKHMENPQKQLLE